MRPRILVIIKKGFNLKMTTYSINSKIKLKVITGRLEKPLFIIAFFLLLGCQNNQYKPLEIFEKNITDIGKVKVYIQNCDKIISKPSSRIIIEDLAKLYKGNMLKKKSITEEELVTLFFYDGNNKYRLSIYSTEDNYISLNYFVNVAKDYYSYYGQYRINPNQFEKINNTIKLECEN